MYIPFPFPFALALLVFTLCTLFPDFHLNVAPALLMFSMASKANLNPLQIYIQHSSKTLVTELLLVLSKHLQNPNGFSFLIFVSSFRSMLKYMSSMIKTNHYEKSPTILHQVISNGKSH